MYPQFDILVPSLNKKMKFRQFLVREEKILLVAKTSNEDNDILTAIKQVVNNCSMDPTFDVDTISVFDLEYLFLKIRSLSVSNVIKLSYKDYEDEKLYEFEINLDEIVLEMPKDVSNKISIIGKNGIVMRYPPASIYSDKEFLNATPEDAAIELIVRCIDKIYDEESVYDPKNFSRQELLDFINQIDIKTFEKINEFLATAPKLKHTITYKNSFGNDRKIELSSLNDFFMLR